MLIQLGDRILSILGVCSFLAARFCYCYIIFYYVWAEPLLIVLLSKIMGGCCDAMIFATAQAIFWLTRVFGVCSECLFVLTRFTCGNIFAAAQAIFWPIRVFGVCSECLFVLTRFTCGNRGKFRIILCPGFNLRVPPRVEVLTGMFV